ncbi:MAG: hypothetical protein NZL83_01270 [Candidatus Absconditabacterales bacterium]|nr:hypothetical protein [Candidatus Absconditabacterales bacterium]
MTASTQLFEYSTDNLDHVKKNLTDACVMFSKYFDEQTRRILEQHIMSMTRRIPRDDVAALPKVIAHMSTQSSWWANRTPTLQGDGLQKLYSLISSAYDHWCQGISQEEEHKRRALHRQREEEERRRQDEELASLENLLDTL